jgi:hypothetical protein
MNSSCTAGDFWLALAYHAVKNKKTTSLISMRAGKIGESISAAFLLGWQLCHLFYMIVPERGRNMMLTRLKEKGL